MVVRCAIATLLLLAACGARPPEVRRVVIVSIDTLRADALGSYGNPNDPTPRLDAIARAGVRATACIAPSPVTLPSHASLLTGLHPLTHGVLVNSHGALSDEVETLAEKLAAHGWSTGAVVASGILRARYGLAQGFDRYRDDLFATSLGAASGRSVSEAPASEAVDAALAWLAERTDTERVFLFLHLIDPHSPYEPPPPHRQRFAQDPYLGEVAFADAEVGRLTDELARRGWLEETLLVATSDHGEHRGAHGLATHGLYLYDEVLQIPLLLRGPGFEAGAVIEAPTTLADVVPTVLAAVGLPADESLQGRSLRGELDAQRRILSVSYDQRLLYDWSPIWSWRGPTEKLVRAPRSQLFRLDADPAELDDLAAREPERTRELESLADRRAAELRAASHEATPVAIDAASRAQLEALGYAAIAGGSELRVRDPLDFSRADPHARRDAHAAISDYMTARVTGDFDSANELLDTALALDPRNPLLAQETGLLLTLERRYGEVVEWYEAQPETARARPDAALHYGRALFALRRHESAEDHLRAALERHPDHTALRLELGVGLSQSGQLDEALAVYDDVIGREPRSGRARYARSELLMRMGRTEQAVTGLEELVRVAPDYAPAYRVLGLQLASDGDSQAALERLDRFLRLAPASPHRRVVEQVMVRLKLAEDP